jgi:hypothetical protein
LLTPADEPEAGVAAGAEGDELELLVLVECPWSAKNHTAANRPIASSAI